jgi:hypothetical protein
MSQNMFEDPRPPPTDCVFTLLPWVWTYLWKIDPVTLEEVAKARGTCNGTKSRIHTLAETYAACVDQPAHRLFWAVVAALNLIATGIDVANAFAEAPGPKEQYFMMVDAPFRDWWENHLRRSPIPKGWVLPVKMNLQGHPEAPRLWHKHVHNILINKLGWEHTTHEITLYYKRDANGLSLILRQVDDFILASATKDHCDEIKRSIQSHMTNPLNELGIIKRFNGVDILQARRFVKIHATT